MFALGTTRTQSAGQRQYVGTYKVTQTDRYIYEVKGAPDNHMGLLEALFNNQDEETPHLAINVSQHKYQELLTIHDDTNTNAPPIYKYTKQKEIVEGDDD